MSTLDFYGILSETKRIVNAHSRHFLALSLLFLLPLSFLLLSFPTFLISLTNPHPNPAETLLRSPHPILYQSETLPIRYQFQTLLFFLLYTLSILILSLSAIATISHSIYHGFFGRPVKLSSSIQSLSSSLWRLSITTLFFALFSFLFSLAFFLGFRLISLLGFQFPSLSLDLLLPIVLLFLGLLVLIYLQANWGLAFVIVVTESSWGLEPLKRSRYLLRGARGIAVSIGLFFAAMIGLMFWFSIVRVDGVGFHVAQTVISVGVVAGVLLKAIAANTVMYMYCKALQGELAGEIASEFAWEYVSLPFDEQKVPHLVTIIQGCEAP
ncbi:uncharacterized protein LOC143857405 [Tasmannia lanceolata]|uniref:uncharacterized protein LOC143857405 n=1 Tax=Tasmannia lanceolata TaxID=3420 RepID=UPI004064555D